jgi:hypothetical protein
MILMSSFYPDFEVDCQGLVLQIQSHVVRHLGGQAHVTVCLKCDRLQIVMKKAAY